MEAFAIGFLSLMFLLSLSFTIYIWWRKTHKEKKEPTNKLTMSAAEERLLLGTTFGSADPNLAAKLLALRVHIRRNKRIGTDVFLGTGLAVTLYSATLLITESSAFISEHTWLTEIVASSFSSLSFYIFIPLFIIMGVTVLMNMILMLRLSAVKDTAPIRLRNMTNKTLKVYIRGIFAGEVLPDSQIENKKVLSVYDSYPIEAKDESGNVVFSKELDLNALEESDWEIEIQMAS
jgi:hypothetical protein